MVSGDGNENRQKKLAGLISKNTTLHVQHTFFVHFSTAVLHDYNVVFFSLPLIFTWVTASISHFLTAAIKFSRYYSNEIGLLCFLSLAPALSQIRMCVL